MMRALVAHAIAQRAASPARVLLVAALVVFPALALAAAPQLGLATLRSGTPIGLVLGAGLIGQEVSAGVLQLLFARPITRAEYVIGRWLAVSALAAGAVALQALLGAAVLALRGSPAPLDALAGLALEQALAACGMVGVLALLSSALPGLGDLMGWAGLYFAGGALQMVGGAIPSPLLLRASQEWGRFLVPGVGLKGLTGGGPEPWSALVVYLSTVTLCLTGAIAVLSRRELSYATD